MSTDFWSGEGYGDRGSAGEGLLSVRLELDLELET